MKQKDRNRLNKLRILFFVEAMGGGVFTYIVDLANQLCENYEVYIAYGLRKQTPGDYQRYFDKKIHLIKVEHYNRNINVKNDVMSYFEMKNIAKRIKPDIIHLHSSKAGVIGRWAFNGHKIPLFYTPHGYSFLMSNTSKLKRNIYRLLEVLSAKRCCTTISCSIGEHQETLKITKKAVCINNGINLKEMQDVITELGKVEKVENNKTFTVFTLGRICDQKNPLLFNEIATRMPSVKFVWIGDGELRTQLTAQNITITGWMDRKSALKLALDADIFMLTSLWEGLPMSLLEAMYMKKLCVVSNVIGNRDVIQNGMNGIVCNVVEDYVEGIRVGMTKQAEELKNRAYDEVLQEYNTVIMAQGYSAAYLHAMRI